MFFCKAFKNCPVVQMLFINKLVLPQLRNSSKTDHSKKRIHELIKCQSMSRTYFWAYSLSAQPGTWTATAFTLNTETLKCDHVVPLDHPCEGWAPETQQWLSAQCTAIQQSGISAFLCSTTTHTIPKAHNNNPSLGKRKESGIH